MYAQRIPRNIKCLRSTKRYTEGLYKRQDLKSNRQMFLLNSIKTIATSMVVNLTTSSSYRCKECSQPPVGRKYRKQSNTNLHEILKKKNALVYREITS